MISLRSRINLALGTGLLLALVLGTAAYLTIDDFLDDARLERRTHATMLLLERSITQLKTAEAWQRRYMITSSGEDLQAYRGANLMTLRILGEARRSLGDDREQALFAQLESLVARRLDNMDLSVEVRQRVGLQAARARIGSEAARQLQQKIEEQIARIKVHETGALEGRRAQTEDGAVAIQWLIVAAGLLSLALLGWAAFLVNFFAAHRRRAEQRLSENMRELERVSQALRASEAQLRQVMDAVPVAIAYVDADERLRIHNKAYEEQIGRSGAQLADCSLREILGPATYEQARPHLAEALAGYAVSYERTRANARGELREYEYKYFPRYGEGGEEGRVVGVYALGSDVTEFRRIDRMKSEFVSTVSHELRTPLTSIRGSLGLAAAGVAGALPERAKKLVDIALHNCERLVRLINDVLDIEKIESGQLQLDARPQALAPLLEAAIAHNEGFAAQHGVTLALEPADAAVRASVDGDRFIQVITNLVSNAVKFAPAGSAVHIRLLAPAGLVRVEVQDRGPGIPADFRSRIFRKFSQADASDTRQKGGTGLGLSISRAIMEQLQGRLDYLDAPGGGTIFFLELPQAQDGAPAAQPGA